MRRYARTLIIIVVLVVLSFTVLGVQSFSIGGLERGEDTILGLKLGLDLQGGSHLVYQAVSEVPPSGEEMEALRKILERRVNSSGLGEPIIQVLGEDRILIQLPGIRDPGRAKSLIGETAQLEFLHRSLNVPRDIGIVPGEIVSARITTVVEEAERLISEANITSTDDGLATTTATSTDSEPSTATSTATSTAVLPSILLNQLVTTTPVMVLTFTADAADRFQEVVDRLAASLAPVPGTGDLYPSLLTIAPEADPLTEVQIPYTTFVQTQFGIVPVGGAPLIERVGLSATYYVILPAGSFAIGTVEDFVEEFGAEPDIVLGEIAGKVDESIGLTGDGLARAYPGQHQGSGVPIVNIEFNGDGTRKFGEVTTRIAGTADLLAIVLDQEELIAPTVQSAITGGAAFIQGRDFTLERVRDIALLLEAGRLPLPIELIQERERRRDPGRGLTGKERGGRLGGAGAGAAFHGAVLPRTGPRGSHGLGLLRVVRPGDLQAGPGHADAVRCGRGDTLRRYGGGRQHPYFRAHEGRAASGADSALVDQHRIQSRMAGDSRQQCLDADNLRHSVLVRRHAGRDHRPGVRRHARDRRRHQYVLGYHGESDPAQTHGRYAIEQEARLVRARQGLRASADSA